MSSRGVNSSIIYNNGGAIFDENGSYLNTAYGGGAGGSTYYKSVNTNGATIMSGGSSGGLSRDYVSGNIVGGDVYQNNSYWNGTQYITGGGNGLLNYIIDADIDSQNFIKYRKGGNGGGMGEITIYNYANSVYLNDPLKNFYSQFNGISNDITGTPVIYGVGGEGETYFEITNTTLASANINNFINTTFPVRDNNPGGKGARTLNINSTINYISNPTNGAPDTGAGGGGNNILTNVPAGSGGSGVVIIKYKLDTTGGVDFPLSSSIALDIGNDNIRDFRIENYNGEFRIISTNLLPSVTSTTNLTINSSGNIILGGSIDAKSYLLNGQPLSLGQGFALSSELTISSSNTSNYVEATSNILLGLINDNNIRIFDTITIFSTNKVNTSNYVKFTSNILVNNINDTSNILLNNINDTSNYVKFTSNILVNNINDISNILVNNINDTSNILVNNINDTSNILVNNINDTSNYVKFTSNILIRNINDTSNYVKYTSNILVNNINDTSNYVKFTSNILIRNINDTSNYITATSNILIDLITKTVIVSNNNTSNYVGTTSNLILNYINNKQFSQWTTLNQNIYYNTSNVGIGTNIPESKLHLYDDAYDNTKLKIQNNLLMAYGEPIQLSITTLSGTPNIQDNGIVPFSNPPARNYYFKIPTGSTETIKEYVFTITESYLCNILIIGGGGGGKGGAFGGGGGAGGLVHMINKIITEGTYKITVGNGGQGGATGNNSMISKLNPINNIYEILCFDNIDLIGKGGGAGGGGSGGCGGGGDGLIEGGVFNSVNNVGGIATQGNTFWDSATTSYIKSGYDGCTYDATQNPNNISYLRSGTSGGGTKGKGTYSNGGGDGFQSNSYSFALLFSGNIGGGGNGNASTVRNVNYGGGMPKQNGTMHTGGGGGGGDTTNAPNSNGGSGLVILAYRKILQRTTSIDLITGTANDSNVDYSIGNYEGNFKIISSVFGSSSNCMIINSINNTTFTGSVNASSYLLGNTNILTITSNYVLITSNILADTQNKNSSKWTKTTENGTSNIYYNNGNVGIGISSFNILSYQSSEGQIFNNAKLYVKGADVNGGTTDIVFSGGTVGGSGSSVKIWLSSDTYSSYIRSEHLGGGNTQLTFGTKNSSDTYNVPNERMVINNLGNVGIGISPSIYKLNVNGSLNATGIFVNGASITNSLQNYWTKEDTTTNIFLNQSGIVSIGTPNDLNNSSKLQVINTHYVGAVLTIDAGQPNSDTTSANMNSTANAIGKPLLKLGKKSYSSLVGDYYGIGYGYSANLLDYSFAEIGAITTNVTGNKCGDLVFSTRATTTNVAPLERMRIKSDGNIGIGTTNLSTYKLNINGSLNVTSLFVAGAPVASSLVNYWTPLVTSNIYFNLTGNVGIGTNTAIDSKLKIGIETYTNALLTIDAGTTINRANAIGKPLLKLGSKVGSTSAGDYYGIAFGYSDNALSEYSFAEIGALTTNVTNNRCGDLVFSTRDTTTNVAPLERMRITSSGKIGIGTTDPSIYNLNINGSINAKSIYVNNDLLNTSGLINYWSPVATNNVFFNGTGNVGIGTITNIDAKLKVSLNVVTPGTSDILTLQNNTNNGIKIEQQYISSTEINYNLIQINNSISKTILSFYNGNVGIGTNTDIVDKLKVNGNIKAELNTMTPGDVDILTLQNNTNNGIKIQQQYISSSNIYYNLIQTNDNTSTTAISFYNGKVAIGLDFGDLAGIPRDKLVIANSRISDTAKLYVNGDINIPFGYQYKVGGQPFATPWYYVGEARNIYFWDDNKVGIGTAAKISAKLQIREQQYLRSILTLDVGNETRYDDGGNTYICARNIGQPLLQIGTKSCSSTPGDYYGIGFGYIPSNLGVQYEYTYAEIGAKTTNTDNNMYGDLVFSTRATTTNVAPEERMRITSDGNTEFKGRVGIGTTIHATRSLEVLGDANILGKLNLSSLEVLGNANISGTLSLNNLLVTGDVLFNLSSLSISGTINASSSIISNSSDIITKLVIENTNSSIYTSSSSSIIELIKSTPVNNTAKSDFSIGNYNSTFKIMSSNYLTPTSPCSVRTALIVNESGGVGIGQEPSFQETGLVVNGDIRLGGNGNIYTSNLFLYGGTINGNNPADWIKNVEGYQYAPSQWIIRDTDYPYTPDKWIKKDAIYAYTPGEWVNRNESNYTPQEWIKRDTDYPYTPQEWIKRVPGYSYLPQSWVNRNEYNYTPNDWVKRTESNYTPDDWIKKSDLVKIIGAYDYGSIDRYFGVIYTGTDYIGRYKFQVNNLLSYMNRPKIQFRLRVAFSSGNSEGGVDTIFVRNVFNSEIRGYNLFFGFFNIIFDEKESNWRNDNKNFFVVSYDSPSTVNYNVDVSWDDWGGIYIIISLYDRNAWNLPPFLNVNIS
jgi:hypothetical protein